MGFQGEKLCTVMQIIAESAVNDDDPIEKPGGVILPEEGFDWFIDLSIKLDEVLQIPRYRFNRAQLIIDCLASQRSSFNDLKEDEANTGVSFTVDEVEERVLSDLVDFLDACLAESAKFKAIRSA